MTSILFVDDEANVLEGLRDMLRRERRRWKMTFAEGGAAAVHLLAEEEFDVVVCDMRMPVIDGSVVLFEARREQPGACRVVLSGQTDRESMLRSVRLTHRFLAKPCDPNELHSTIESLLALVELLPNEHVRRAVGSITALPSQTDVHETALATVANPECLPADVAAIARLDPAIAANVLRIGNSGFFGAGRPVATVEEATEAIGADALRAPELATALFDGEYERDASYPLDLRATAEHSLRVGDAVAAAVPDDEAAFAVGFLHDIGRLVLAETEPELLREVLAEAEARSCGPHVVERERLGVTDAEMGAYLLGLWGLPEPIVAALADHGCPGEPKGALARAIRAAEAPR